MTEQEQQLIECLREASEFREWSLAIRREDGAFEILVSCDGKKGRGVGATFDAAWDNVAGLFLEGSGG
jgi:hypothetical protein